MTIRLEAIPRPSTLEFLRVFCVECERRAELLWCDKDRHGLVQLIHIRCHGEERLVVMHDVTVRKAIAIERTHLDLLWSELEDAGTDEELQEMAMAEENSMLACAERTKVIERVLVSRSNGRKA